MTNIKNHFLQVSVSARKLHYTVFSEQGNFQIFSNASILGPYFLIEEYINQSIYGRNFEKYVQYHWEGELL